MGMLSHFPKIHEGLRNEPDGATFTYTVGKRKFVFRKEVLQRRPHPLRTEPDPIQYVMISKKNIITSQYFF